MLRVYVSGPSEIADRHGLKSVHCTFLAVCLPVGLALLGGDEVKSCNSVIFLLEKEDNPNLYLAKFLTLHENR